MGEEARQTRHYELLREAQSENEHVSRAATEALICENMGLVRTAAPSRRRIAVSRWATLKSRFPRPKM